MSSLFEDFKSDEANKPETVAGAALVAHIAALLSAEGEGTFPWVQQELISGRLKTPGGARPFVLEEEADGSIAPRAGEMPKNAAAELPDFQTQGLRVRDQGAPPSETHSATQDGEGPATAQRWVFQSAEWRGRRFLAAIVLPLISAKDWLQAAAARLRKTRVIAVIVYLIVWIMISYHMMRIYHTSFWLFFAIGAATAVFLYFQIMLAVSVEAESALFDRLRLILIAVSGVFISFAIFAGASPIIPNPALTIEIVLLGLAVTFATFAINPRATELKVLNWANNTMRVAIAIGVSCVSVVIFMTLFYHFGEGI